MSAIERINAAICRERFDAFYATWDSLPQLKDCDSVVFLVGKARDDEDSLPKMGLFHLWSFMLIFPDTLIVLMRDKKIAFAARPKKLAYFEELKSSVVGEAYDLQLFPREPSMSVQDAMRQSGLAALLKSVTARDGSNVPTVGAMLHPSVLPYGAAAESLMEAIGFPARGLADLDDQGVLTIKTDESDIRPDWRWRAVDEDIWRITLRLGKTDMEYARLAAMASARMAREVVINQVVNTLDQETKETHAAICSGAEIALDDQARAKKWKAKYDIDMDALDIGYCLVESGSIFTLDPATVATEQNLWLGKGSICVGLAVKYHNNLAHLARTVLMDLGKPEQALYQAALTLENFAIGQVKPGRKCSEIFNSIWRYAQEKHPELARFLQPNFGGPVGLQMQPADFVFDAKSQEIVDPGMAVAITIAAPNIKLPDARAPFAIWLSDTFPVPATEAEETSPSRLWTSACTKKMDDVLYSLEEAEETTAAGAGARAGGTAKENRSETNAPSRKRSEVSSRAGASAASRKSPGTPGPRTRSRRVAAGVSHAEQEKLLTKQRELRRKKQREITERFREGGVGFAKDKKSVQKLSQITAYRDVSEFPKDLRPNKLHVDPVKEAVLVPIGQRHVPFHVSTIRNVVHQDEDGTKTHVLRISFNVPGATATGTKTEESPLPDLSSLENGLFIKEILVKSADNYLATQAKALRELQKRVRTKELNRQEDELTQQQNLQLSRIGHRRLLLRNLMVRHSAAHSRRTVGQLEAHQNGFRYQAPRCENIDIIYQNIRYAFFQPVSNELIILLHFHLKNPIMVQKKRVKDLQFYCEISTQADDLDARRNRSAYDPDEILEEEREYERKKKLNAEFKRFVDQVQELANIEFEIPIKGFAFYGVPKNSSVIMTPTQNCLVSLADWPAFILPMEDVEIVSLERVIHGLRHFDAVFVYKDYMRPVQTIATIPVESLDMLKSWLNEMEMVWYEGKRNLSWPAILKTIRADIHSFVDDGGFESFLGEGEEGGSAASEEEEETSDEDEEFRETSSASSSEADESSEEEASDEEGSDEEDEDSDVGSDEEQDSEEDEGMTLEDMERQEITKAKRRAAANLTAHSKKQRKA